jgi:hypothetical protein
MIFQIFLCWFEDFKTIWKLVLEASKKMPVRLNVHLFYLFTLFEVDSTWKVEIVFPDSKTMRKLCIGQTIQARIAYDLAPWILLPLANFQGKFRSTKKKKKIKNLLHQKINSKFSKFLWFFFNFFSEFFEANKRFFKKFGNF